MVLSFLLCLRDSQRTSQLIVAGTILSCCPPDWASGSLFGQDTSSTPTRCDEEVIARRRKDGANMRDHPHKQPHDERSLSCPFHTVCPCYHATREESSKSPGSHALITQRNIGFPNASCQALLAQPELLFGRIREIL